MSKFTKLEREYVKGIVHNLSMQRLSDKEIVQWLQDEKKINVDRSTISRIRNQVEKDAAKWYTELRDSGSKYVALYKERLDSLLSYKKTLNEIILYNKNKGATPEIVLKAIAELHRIEMSLHTLLKELPGDIRMSNEKQEDVPIAGYQPKFWGDKDNNDPLSDTWTLDPAPNPEQDQPLPKAISYLPKPIPETIVSTLTITEPKPNPTQSAFSTHENTDKALSEPLTKQEQEPEHRKDIVVDIDVLGRWPKPFDVEPWVQCKFNNSNCNKWFKNKEIRNKHIAKYHT